MYHPTTRVLAVLELLQSRPGISGAAIAARLEVDRRTVRRYITMLQDLGVPVEGERGPEGGYALRPGTRLPPLMLSDDEALAVVLGLLAARRQGLVDPLAAEGASAKIERVLPEAPRRRLRALQSVVAYTRTPALDQPDPDILLHVATAAHERRRVHIAYRSGEQDTERDVEVFGLVHHWGRWYLVGHCHLRRATRVFRVDRIVRANVTDRPIGRRRQPNALQTVLRTLALGGRGHSVDVLLETTLDQAQDRVPPGAALLTSVRGGVRLQAHVDDLDRIARLLLTVGCDFTVQACDELRVALRRVGEQALASAQGSLSAVRG